MKLFSDEVPDQYYAVTARLAARGQQQTTMRVVAGCILTLSLPALASLTNPASTRIPIGWLALVVIVLMCLALAAPWMRHRWPTRTQSITVVLVGALVLATGCTVASDPLAGLLVATAFAFVLGFAALFHGARVQIFACVVAALTIGWLAVRIAMKDIATTFAVVTPVVLINIAILVACRTIAEITAANAERADVEPLTGLLTRDSFEEMAGTLLGARNRDDDRYLVVAVVTIDSFAALLSIRGSRGADRARVAVGQALRDTVRHDAVIGHVGDAEFLVADSFTTSDPAPLAERILSAVAATPGGITASIGVVSTPLRPLVDRPPRDVFDEIIAQATAAMYRARRRGGNTAEYIVERGSV